MIRHFARLAIAATMYVAALYALIVFLAVFR